IAIDQVNPVRNSRSTVGTMTELNDHLKLLYARTGRLYCQCCAQLVQRDSPESIHQELLHRVEKHDPRLIVTFPIAIPANFTEEEVRGFLEQQGYTRIHHEETRAAPTQPTVQGKKTGKSRKAPSVSAVRVLHVVQDRFRLGNAETARVMEALEAALKQGDGHITVYASEPEQELETAWRFSSRLHCAQCDIEYSSPLPSTFSFNSPLGACEACRGFGRVMGIDYGLVI